MRLVIAVVQTMILIIIGKAMYGFDVSGSWPGLIGLVVFGALTFISIGAVISSTAKTQESGMPIVQLVNMPMMFLSGLFFPVEILPKAIQWISSFLPATYLADALRNVTTSAPLAHPIFVDLGAMALWMAICLAVATRIFKWE
jgi:ABC-2 type transport system permease protein